MQYRYIIKGTQYEKKYRINQRMVVMLFNVIVSVAAGLAAAVGALPVLFFRKIPEVLYDALLGFAAGVMLFAACFSLIIPALEKGGVVKTVIGIIAAVIFVYLIEKTIPHLHPHFGRDLKGENGFDKELLMVMAIVLHNLPEGLAVGVGLVSGVEGLGLMLALAIAAQNIPEGLAVAAPMAKKGLSPSKIIGITLLSGLAEPAAALVGMTLCGFSQRILSYGLAFAAGAMIYVVSDHIIPECHSHGNETQATWGVMLGVITMLFLQEMVG
ncbi:MAG: ZIP family metal transporter [Clostridia bacterium]|nr:ZIP family metal transporter [Clostridia bacterium]